MATPPIPSSDFFKVIERIFLSPRVSVTVALASGALIIAGHSIPDLAPFVQHYGLLVWLVLLISGCYSLTFPVQWLWHWIAKKMARRRWKNRVIERLHSLTIPEKHLLQWHVEEDNGVTTWSVNRREVNSLGHSGLLELIHQVGSIGTFKLMDGPRKYLLEHKDLIATPDNPRPPRSKNEWMI